MTNYDHIKFGGPVFWDILSTLFARMFSSVKVPSQFKVKLILPLLKGRGLRNITKITTVALPCSLCSVKSLQV